MAMMQKNQIKNAIESDNDVDSVPIALTGFWAKGNVNIDCVVPKINGVGCARVEKPLKPVERSNCRVLAAKDHAEVGEDIRWDIIFQEAAKFPCAPSHAKPVKSDSDDAMSTNSGGSTDSDADTDANSGSERIERAPKSTKSSSTSQSEVCVYSIVTMLRVWDLCRRCPATPPVGPAAPAPPSSEPFAPPPGLAAPPGLSAPPGFGLQTPISAPQNQKAKKVPPVESQKAEGTVLKEANSKQNKLDRLLKVMKEEQDVIPVSAAPRRSKTSQKTVQAARPTAVSAQNDKPDLLGKAPWRRNVAEPPPQVLSAAPWRSNKDTAMTVEAMHVAPPPGL